MSQKKVEEYKQNKVNRNKESKKEVRARKLEIGILIAVIIAGVVWFAVAGITRSLNAKSETVELNTTAIDSYVYEVQSGAGEDAEPELTEDSEEAADTETGEE